MAMPSVSLIKGKNQSTQSGVSSAISIPFFCLEIILAGSVDFLRHAQVLFNFLIQYMIKLHLNMTY